MRRVVDAWKRGDANRLDRPALRRFMGPGGTLNEDAIATLTAERDDRGVDLLE